jgi:squalene-associated FAD-dependent desaturase
VDRLAHLDEVIGTSLESRIAIIGGGWSGLAAAVTLAAEGIPATLFEAARQLGGRARRVDLNGAALDNGQHILLGAYTETLRLLRELHPGAEADVLIRQGLRVLRPGGLRLRSWPLPAPLHLAGALLGARGLRMRERMAALQFFAEQRSNRFRAAPGSTVAQLLKSQPAILVDQLWEPLCVAALNTPAREASAQIFLNVLRVALTGSRSASDFLLPGVDLDALFPGAAAAWLDRRGTQVRLGEPIVSLTATDSGYALRLANGSEEIYDTIVCAVAPQHFSRLTEGLPTLLPLRRVVGRFAYQPIATVYVQCRRPVGEIADTMLQLDGKPGQWLFDRGGLGGPAGLYAVVISAAGTARGLGQHELGRAVVDQLRRFWPAWPDPLWLRAIVEKRATFSCTPDLARPECGRVMRGFYLAGDYTDPEFPATLEAAVRTGVRAAEALLADLGPASLPSGKRLRPFAQ